jgi:hypothetical protein
VTLWSRQGKQLTGYFPELTAAVASEVPPGCVVDGEAVIWAGGRLDFSALQQRLGAGPKTLPGQVRHTPASYVAFDVLAVAGHDARALPFRERRALLEELARGWRSTESLSRRSAMMGTSWVRATFQLGGGGLPSISLASNWLRKSPVALDITYLPHMDSLCPTSPSTEGEPEAAGHAALRPDDRRVFTPLRRLDEGRYLRAWTGS